MHFEFATASHILFGPGTCVEVPTLAAALGQRVLFVTDSVERCKSLLDNLKTQGLFIVIFLVKKEPDINCVIMATRNAQESECQFVIGFGGGAALDTGKAAAALLTNPGSPFDYLEIIGAGKKLENPSCPYIASPPLPGLDRR